jgi:hypothetical protein
VGSTVRDGRVLGDPLGAVLTVGSSVGVEEGDRVVEGDTDGLSDGTTWT